MIVNLASVILLTWIGVVIYESIVGTGIWHRVDAFLSGDYSAPSPAAVFSICLLAGMAPISAAGWLAWRLFARGRRDAPIPEARLRR